MPRKTLCYHAGTMNSISMENFWHPIATSAEVGAQPKQFMLLGERIVVYRHDAGVSAFMDVCVHTAFGRKRPRAISDP
jgi:phenylpropionate dioxygenase-like ring-hydroxylating dioxygenase large terminal subunit